MGSIADRLAARKEPSGDAMMDRLYNDMIKRVEAQALEEARREVKLDVSKHLADVVRMTGEVEAANAGRDAAILRNDSYQSLADDSHAEALRLREKAEKLEQALTTVKSSWTATKEKLRTNREDVGGELLTEQIKTEQLRLKVASLEGRIVELKNIKPLPIKTSAPLIPSFKFEPVRGGDGRTISMIATPIGAN